MTDSVTTFQRIKTDSVMFDYEPGRASQTKIAMSIIDLLPLVNPEELSEADRAEFHAIRTKLVEFMNG